MKIDGELQKLVKSGLFVIGIAFCQLPSALVAQETLPVFSGNYRSASEPLSIFVPFSGGSPSKWEDVCCMQLGKCRPCDDMKIALDKDNTKGIDVVRLVGETNELLICKDPGTKRIFQCPVVLYEKGTLKQLK